MKLKKKDLSPIWYCLYESKEALKDEEGNETGEHRYIYGDPTKKMCNVSSAKGSAQTDMFGNLDSYDKVIITDDKSCPIDENSVLYVDKEPDGIPDYIVKRVAKSPFFISYAVSKVNVS